LELKIQTKNVEINERVRNHIERKLGQLNRHLPGISKVAVELTSEPTRSQQDRIVAQVTLNVSDSVLRAEQRTSSTTGAINSVADVLDRRIERYKSRAYRSERARQNTPLRAQEAQEAQEEPQSVPPAERESLPNGSLVRVKQFDMKPLTVEEAAFQMQLLGHSFFMFLNSESNDHNLLYLRDDGNYGLIQPKTT
jgi:putative sigma-54 modulation protein